MVAVVAVLAPTLKPRAALPTLCGPAKKKARQPMQLPGFFGYPAEAGPTNEIDLINLRIW